MTEDVVEPKPAIEQRKRGHPYDEKYYSAHVNVPSEGAEPFWNFLVGLLVERLHPEKVLDAGCAMGMLVREFRAQSVEAYGVDISEVAVADKIADGLSVCDLDSDRLPFADDSLDMITAIEVVEHLTNDAHFVGEACRVLKPGGFVFITTPSLPFMPSRSLTELTRRLIGRYDKTHVNEHGRKYWRSCFESSGGYQRKRFQYLESFGQEFVKFRMKTGYRRLPWHEGILFKMGPPGRYAVAKLHSAFSANMVFKVVPNGEPGGER